MWDDRITNIVKRAAEYAIALDEGGTKKIARFKIGDRVFIIKSISELINNAIGIIISYHENDSYGVTTQGINCLAYGKNLKLTKPIRDWQSESI